MSEEKSVHTWWPEQFKAFHQGQSKGSASWLTTPMTVRLFIEGIIRNVKREAIEQRNNELILMLHAAEMKSMTLKRFTDAFCKMYPPKK